MSLVDWPDFWRILQRSAIELVAVVVALRFGGILISAFKWQLLLSIHDIHHRLTRLLRWYLVASFLNQFLPTNIGGDGYRIYKTWDNLRGGTASVLAVVLERVTGFGALVALGALAAGLLVLAGEGDRLTTTVGVAGAAILLLALFAAGLYSALGVPRALRNSRFWRYIEGLGGLAKDFRVRRGKTAAVIALSFLFHTTKLLAIWLLVYALGTAVNPLQLMVAILIIDFAGLLPISLGGLGVVEGAFMLIMGQFGINAEVALATMLLLRVLMLPIHLIGAVLYFKGDEREGTNEMMSGDSHEQGDSHLDDGDDLHLAYLESREPEYHSDLESGKIERSNFEANKEFLESSGLLNGNVKILEVGCGAGSMTAYLAHLGFEVIGTDVSEVLLRYAKRAHPQCTFQRMMGELLEFDDDSFDLVVSFDVVEHIPDIGGHLREVRRVLHPNGHYLLQTPNKWTNLPFSIIRDRSLSRWKRYHPSLQTRKSLIRLLDRHGFSSRIIRMDVSNEFFRQKLVFPLNLIDFDKIPIQTNLYAIARLRRGVRTSPPS